MEVINNNRIRIKNDEFRDLIITACPVCGFVFRSFDPKTRKRKYVCPMCGYRIRIAFMINLIETM